MERLFTVLMPTHPMLFLAQAAQAQNGQGFLVLLWRALTIIAGAAAVTAAVMMWHGFTMDRSNGEWKHVIARAVMVFAVPTIIGAFMFMFWGIAAPALNWG